MRLRQHQRFRGARLPLCSQSLHRPLPAVQERPHARQRSKFVAPLPSSYCVRGEFVEPINVNMLILRQVQRGGGDHHRGLNKFSSGGGGGGGGGVGGTGGGGATASNSQQPLTSSNPLPMSSSATQSMTSLSRFAQTTTTTPGAASLTAISTISGVQANGNDNQQSKADAERDSNNLS